MTPQKDLAQPSQDIAATPSGFKRRDFIKNTVISSAAAVVLGGSRALADSANNQVKLACIGLGRGLDLVKSSLEIPQTEIRYLCDVDSRRIDRATAVAEKAQGRRPKGTQDLRRVLEDPEVDAVLIATCNHWHAPATIMACNAGKHVYVEKPGSHNPHEAALMVQAARKNRRVVQLGNQRRSWPGVIEAVERLRSGAIGKVTYGRCWYNNARGSIGRGKPASVPPELDYSLWQGPVPARPYKDNLIHYNWHWHWHWGNGELGNNGIHCLDVIRWGLGVDYPLRVTCNGGRYSFEDDQETPDTFSADYDFGGSGASFEASSCHRRRADDTGWANFYGDEGTLVISGVGYKIFDPDGKLVENITGEPTGGVLNEKGHIANFLECIRNGKQPNSEIEEGQKSTMLCHLGNIAYRTGHTIHFDPKKQRIINDKEAEKLWSREYRDGWAPKV